MSKEKAKHKHGNRRRDHGRLGGLHSREQLVKRYILITFVLKVQSLIESANSARNSVMATVKHPRPSVEATWSVPYDLINSECDAMEWSSSETVPTAFLHEDHSPKVFDLFIQWVYTRKYNEEDGHVEA
jgi:hypothetical protein